MTPRTPAAAAADPTLASLLGELIGDLHRPQIVWQLLALALIAGMSILAALWIHSQMRGADGGDSRELTAATRSSSLFTLIAGVSALLGAHIAEDWHRHANLVRVAALLLLAMGAVRFISYVVRRVFPASGALRVLQRLIAAVVWILVALQVTGSLPTVLHALEIPVYGSPETHNLVTLLQLIKAGIGVCVALVVALWAGAALDARLSRFDSLDVSLRVALSRFLRALLLVVAVLACMEAVGIPIGVLSVFGGALGVGLGLGLQRIASSYVSGFIILLDRSLRIGDLVSVDKYQGTVAQIRTRYTVVQSLDGTEAIIPNEQLVSNIVVNQSFTSTKVRVAIKLVVTSDADLDKALAIMLDAAGREERVLADPPPSALLSGFPSDGLELELGMWVGDPEKGTGVVRSDIGRFIVAEFKKAGIILASPQRDVRLSVPDGVTVHTDAVISTPDANAK